MSNLDPQKSQKDTPGSPSASMRTHPSATNPNDLSLTGQLPPSTTTVLPAQLARMHPAHIGNDSATNVYYQGDSASRPARSPTFTMTQGASASPQPSSQANVNTRPSAGSISAAEPRIFPGVVSRHRTSSIQRPMSSTFSDKDGEGAATTTKKSAPDGDSVAVEE